MTNKPERTVEEIVNRLVSVMFVEGYVEKENLKELHFLLTPILQTERQRCEEMVSDIIKMADALELECGKDGDKGTKQWMAFKGFRNTIRDKYLNHPEV